MTLRNRCDPLGALHVVPTRGAWMGNRGCLHDDAGRIVRGFRGRRWITCVTSFRGRRRALMQPGRYTELFFRDEATAYAAGHRPCAQCRHADWQRFAARWAGQFGPARTDAIDSVLHGARLDGGVRRLVPVDAGAVPDGAMVRDARGVFLRASDGWHRWHDAGYVRGDPVGPLRLVTPEPLVALMRHGLPVQTDLNG